MAHELEEMPLFPLQTVLFPYAQLEVHVFEDRYRDMLNRCIDFDEAFGVVLIRNGAEVGDPNIEPYMVGTAVRIVKVQRYDDGKMDVHVKGERRFRVRKIDESKPYLTGYVEPVFEMDVEDNPRTNALMMRARESFRTLVEGMLARPDFSIQVQFPPDPTVLSFVIADFLSLENIEKQKLLETTDTAERFAELIPLIERQIIEAKPHVVQRLTSKDLEDWIFPN